jgi:hypothetical protein
MIESPDGEWSDEVESLYCAHFDQRHAAPIREGFESHTLSQSAMSLTIVALDDDGSAIVKWHAALPIAFVRGLNERVRRTQATA